MEKKWMIYGANGYSAQLIIENAIRRGLPKPVLAGRSPEKLMPFGKKYNAPVRTFSLVNPTTVRKNIADVTLVLHCAGPFSKTFSPMVEACVSEKVHYLDITGEIEVFERIYESDMRAKNAGVTLIPGLVSMWFRPIA